MLAVVGCVVACNGMRGGEPVPISEAEQLAEVETGALLFRSYCVSCHGPDAGGGALGPTLVSAQVAAKDQAFFQEIIAKGRSGTSMPPWDGLLSPQQIENVIASLRSEQLAVQRLS